MTKEIYFIDDIENVNNSDSFKGFNVWVKDGDAYISIKDYLTRKVSSSAVVTQEKLEKVEVKIGDQVSGFAVKLGDEVIYQEDNSGKIIIDNFFYKVPYQDRLCNYRNYLVKRESTKELESNKNEKIVLDSNIDPTKPLPLLYPFSFIGRSSGKIDFDQLAAHMKTKKNYTKPLDENAEFANGDNILHLLIKEGSDDDKKFLIPQFIELGANINAKNKEGKTPFILACEQNSVSTAKALLESAKGSNIDLNYSAELDEETEVASKREKANPLGLAKRSKNYELGTLLVQYGARGDTGWLYNKNANRMMVVGGAGALISYGSGLSALIWFGVNASPLLYNNGVANIILFSTLAAAFIGAVCLTLVKFGIDEHHRINQQEGSLLEQLMDEKDPVVNVEVSKEKGTEEKKSEGQINNDKPQNGKIVGPKLDPELPAKYNIAQKVWNGVV